MAERRAFTTEEAAAALLAITEKKEDHAEELQQYNGTQSIELNEALESCHHIYDSFVKSEGPKEVLKITNFSPHEIKSIYVKSCAYLQSHWKIGRGRKC